MPHASPLTPPDFLAAAIDLREPRDIALVDCPPGTLCRVSAKPIAQGYRVMDVVTDANTEFLDQFRGEVRGFVSAAAGRCYKSAAPRDKHRVGDRLVANPCAKSHLAVQLPSGGVEYVSPTFDPATAVANGTVTWSVAARRVWAEHRGRNAFVLVTPDFKRRLWPYARAGILGERTPVYVLNKAYNLDGQQFLDWGRLVELLGVVEPLLRLGYAKDALRGSLLSAPSSTHERVGAAELGERPAGEKVATYKGRCLSAGRVASALYERELRPLRGSLEYTMAVMMAARELTDAEREAALRKRAA